MKERKRAGMLVCLIAVLAAVCLAAIALPGKLFSRAGEERIARIYQDGELIDSIPLGEVEEVYFLDIESPSGGSNRIEVRPGMIGICSADCPDQLCVKQGFRSDGALPIVCLPHRLVIWVEAEEEGQDGGLDAVVR